MMRAALTLCVLTLLGSSNVALAAADAPLEEEGLSRSSAAPESVSPWTTESALTAAEGRWEFGLFHPLHWAVSDRVELSLQPLLFALMPNLQAKVNWYGARGFYVSTRHALTYPSFLLSLLSKEGALGLLPATTEVPQGIIIASDVLVTAQVAKTHWLTLELGFQVAPRGPGDMPVMDFPFLYPHFAVLSTDGVIHGGFGVEGVIGEHFGYRADVDIWWLPVIEGGYAFEQGLALTWRISPHVALAAGYRLSHARYPAGEQLHVLPSADLLIGL